MDAEPVDLPGDGQGDAARGASWRRHHRPGHAGGLRPAQLPVCRGRQGTTYRRRRRRLLASAARSRSRSAAAGTRSHHAHHRLVDPARRPGGDDRRALPPAHDADDVEAVKAVAVPVGTPPPGWRIDVTSINRGFLLGGDYLPGASFLDLARQRGADRGRARGGVVDAQLLGCTCATPDPGRDGVPRPPRGRRGTRARRRRDDLHARRARGAARCRPPHGRPRR